MVKFLRRTWRRYSKLGKGRKKKQIWRRPTGRDNKMRERRRGYPARVSVGYISSKELKNKIDGKTPVKIMNVQDLEKVGKNEIVIIGKVGKKKRIEITKIIKDKKIQTKNLNETKFLKLTKKNESK